MNSYFSNQDVYLYCFDTFLALVVYGLSIVLFLKQKREYILPLLIFGLFIFPVQFSIWFLKNNIDIMSIIDVSLFKVLYLLLLKVSLILTIIFSKK